MIPLWCADRGHSFPHLPWGGTWRKGLWGHCRSFRAPASYPKEFTPGMGFAELPAAVAEHPTAYLQAHREVALGNLWQKGVLPSGLWLLVCKACGLRL